MGDLLFDLSIYLPHAWTILAMIGGVLAILSLVDSIVDFTATRPTNGFRVLAMGDIAQESLRFVLYVMYTGLGVWAINRGPASPTTSPGGWVLLTALLVLVTKTVIQILIRRYLRVTHATMDTNPETQDQREDREFGEQRRALEQEHIESD